ncbi:hypothetical protein Rleg9DRAFT_0512 [Rhizobium leguminosarum bv. trifolii WSM597]|uniref:Uncharacterized protein n=1 Tax=Rhizobium leguminosarum bv. trifolii WSM597 TaxID=754764 RepID=J0GW53_RHILT|nr:hypothetical protein [Rhizobium leguminosarum]EJB01768.1 hypothetical protein Rleg9DRAFT_0512 [Rhizobium leguminosarum bv. trifolii WSM597]
MAANELLKRLVTIFSDDDLRHPQRLAWIPKALTVVAALAVVLFVGMSILRTGAAVDDSVPKSWNTAIERLGITPLYPPQEDAFVGDVLLAVTPSKLKFSNLSSDLQVEAITGRSVRVGHINLTKFMKRPDDTRYFGDSVRDANGSLALAQPTREVDSDPLNDGKILLSNILFPAITLEHEANVSGVWKAFGMGASSASAEKIVLSHVQTYGADAYSATALLAKYCADPSTLGFCFEKSARAQLSYIMGDDVLRTATTVEGKPGYVFEVRIFVIYRLYLARGLQVGGGDGVDTRLFSSEAGRTEAMSMNSIDYDANGEPPKTTSPVDVKPKTVKITNQPLTASRSDKRSFWSDEPFNRPLAIGYRSVSFGMQQ